MIWLKKYWQIYKFILIFALLVALICIMLTIGWLMLPSPGRAIYNNEMLTASHNPDSIVASQFRKWAPTQKLLVPQQLPRGFVIKINQWKVLLHSTPAEIGLEPLRSIHSLPAHMTAAYRISGKWISITMRKTPDPWRNWGHKHHDIIVQPPSNWSGWKLLAQTKPSPGQGKLILGDFYGFFPLGSSGLQIQGIWPDHELRSVGFAYARTGVTWLHTRLYPLIRHLLQPYIVGHDFYDIQKGDFSVIRWGLLHAGIPPWRASHVIASAARNLLGYTDMQLMRMAFSSDMSQLPRAMTAAKAVQTAILVASVSITGHRVFWVKTRSGGYICFWLQTPYAIMAEHFNRAGVAYPDAGIINCKLIGLHNAHQWASRMRKIVEKALPFFVAGPPWENVRVTEKGKD